MKILVSASIFLVAKAIDHQLCMPNCTSGECIFDLGVRLAAGQLGAFHGHTMANVPIVGEVDISNAAPKKAI